jgi:hypothetical protein
MFSTGRRIVEEGLNKGFIADTNLIGSPKVPQRQNCLVKVFVFSKKKGGRQRVRFPSPPP